MRRDRSVNVEYNQRDSQRRVMTPKCLYGEKSRVRKDVARICRSAWKDGAWHNAVCNLEMVDLFSAPGWIALSHCDSRLLWPKERWNLNWFSQELRKLTDKYEDRDKARELSYDGMQFCWFTLAMLSQDTQGMWGEVWDETHATDLRLLDHYIQWLPEMEALRVYLTHDDLRDPELQFDLSWAYMIIRCVNELGTPLEVNDVYERYRGSLSEALLALAVVETDGERYRLGRRFRQT